MAGSMPNGVVYDEKGWHDAGLDAHWAWERFREAKSPVEQAAALVELNDRMFDLSTFLPGYDGEHDEITDPRPDA